MTNRTLGCEVLEYVDHLTNLGASSQLVSQLVISFDTDTKKISLDSQICPIYGSD